MPTRRPERLARLRQSRHLRRRSPDSARQPDERTYGETLCGMHGDILPTNAPSTRIVNVVGSQGSSVPDEDAYARMIRESRRLWRRRRNIRRGTVSVLALICGGGRHGWTRRIELVDGLFRGQCAGRDGPPQAGVARLCGDDVLLQRCRADAPRS